MQAAFPRLAVIGAGTMGMGIVEVFVTSGHHVLLVDASKEMATRALEQFRKRLDLRVERGKITGEIADVMWRRVQCIDHIDDITDVQFVVEAIVENLAIKQQLFKELDAHLAPETILASNTSSLSITSIASVTKNPERVMGLHFFNPAPRMPLVEVVQGLQTSSEKVDTMMEWIRHLGKDPVRVRDSPGFVVNRIARPFHLEAYRLVGNGLASKEQVDRLLRDAGFKMGPFELQDLIGIDINYAASVSVYNDFFQEARYRPHSDQRMLVDSGSLGRKVGKGHYDYAE